VVAHKVAQTGDETQNWGPKIKKGGLPLLTGLSLTYVLWNTKTDRDIHNIYELLLHIDALNQALGNT
jgi:hypothetical protein